MGLAGEVALAADRHLDEFDPRKLSRITLDDLVGAVARTIVDDDPFQRTSRLRNHRLDRQLDEFSFVPSGRYQNITRGRGALGSRAHKCVPPLTSSVH